jgi:hypothetical protein
MNTMKSTHRIIAPAIVAITAGLGLAACAEHSTPGGVVQQLTDAQVAELRSGLEALAESRAELSRDLAQQRGSARSEDAQAMRDLAESRARMSRDLAQLRASARAEEAQAMRDLAESRARMSRDLAE